LYQANSIRPTIPVPTFINHINVAAKGVEVLLPTPTPSNIALVDKDPDKRSNESLEYIQMMFSHSYI
jgi:hypothetical protein